MEELQSNQPLKERKVKEQTAETEIYNLIILDESGSMFGVRQYTIDGCNETIESVQSAQKQFADTQDYFISIYVFQSGAPSRYLTKNTPATAVSKISTSDYAPSGCTPLFDAVGSTLSDLKIKVSTRRNAIGSVTIITDGMENASCQYSGSQVARMISELKEEGWNFNLIGANIDVDHLGNQMNIDNKLSFVQSKEGMHEMWKKERSSRLSYFSKIEEVNNFMMNMDSTMPEHERKIEFMRRAKMADADYFADAPAADRITPEVIRTLQPNEVFVFGSNLQGAHQGGAALQAVKQFGAVMGQGVGLQGQSYAIPTMHGGVETIAPYVNEFINFAKANPNLKFLVTRIGCGIAGFKDRDIAPLFSKAVNVPNICLPNSFWKEIIVVSNW